MKMYIVAAVSFCIGHIIACIIEELPEQGCKRQPIRASLKVIMMQSILIGITWPVYLAYIFVTVIDLSRGEVGTCSTSQKKKKKSITEKWRGFWKRRS